MDVSEQDRKPPVGQQVQPGPVGGAASPKIYFVSDQGTTERLESVSRDVADAPDSVLSELLKGLTADELDRRLHTFIPAETQLLGTELHQDGTLDVDLSKVFFDAKAEDGIKAVGQIVYTACALPAVKQVRLLIQGEPRDWPRGRRGQRVRAADAIRLPGAEPVEPARLSPPARRRSHYDAAPVSRGGRRRQRPSTRRATKSLRKVGVVRSVIAATWASTPIR